MSDKLSPQELEKLFKEYDVNQDGSLCDKDLKHVLAKIGRTDVTDSEIQRMIKLADVNQNGKIDFNEFSHFMNLATSWFSGVPGRNKFLTINASTENIIKTLLAGGIAGSASRTLVSPLERLKIIYQTQTPSSAHKYGGIIDSLKLIYKEEGLKGYFKGNGLNCLRIFPANACQFYFYDFYKTLLPIQKGKTELTPLQRLTAGGMAGITGLVITYPLDLLRAYASVQVETVSISEVAKRVYKNSGVLGFYRGLWPGILGVVPYVGIDFAAYDLLKRNTPKSFLNKDGSIPAYVTLSHGAVAGSVAQTVAYPLDLIRRRIQVQMLRPSPNPEENFKGTTDAMIKIYKSEGVKGYFKGLLPNYLKVVPAISVSFLVFEKLKLYMGIKTSSK